MVSCVALLASLFLFIFLGARDRIQGVSGMCGKHLTNQAEAAGETETWRGCPTWAKGYFVLASNFVELPLFPSQGDLKRYLRAQRPPEGVSPELPPRDLRTLQRMGLEIARGLAHLHSHNYVHR